MRTAFHGIFLLAVKTASPGWAHSAHAWGHWLSATVVKAQVSFRAGRLSGPLQEQGGQRR